MEVTQIENIFTNEPTDGDCPRKEGRYGKEQTDILQARKGQAGESGAYETSKAIQTRYPIREPDRTACGLAVPKGQESQA